jgi:antitoxin component YwqK of YwqJK toxin-antitoxin module
MNQIKQFIPNIDHIDHNDLEQVDEKLATNTNGMIRTYWPNGQINKEYFQINGNIEGVRKSYFSNGKIAEIKNFVNGIPHGECRVYYYSDTSTDNNELQICNYSNGKLDGECKYFSIESNKWASCVFSNGQIQGHNDMVSSFWFDLFLKIDD